MQQIGKAKENQRKTQEEYINSKQTSFSVWATASHPVRWYGALLLNAPLYTLVIQLLSGHILAINQHHSVFGMLFFLDCSHWREFDTFYFNFGMDGDCFFLICIPWTKCWKWFKENASIQMVATQIRNAIPIIAVYSFNFNLAVSLNWRYLTHACCLHRMVDGMNSNSWLLWFLVKNFTVINIWVWGSEGLRVWACLQCVLRLDINLQLSLIWTIQILLLPYFFCWNIVFLWYVV